MTLSQSTNRDRTLRACIAATAVLIACRLPERADADSAPPPLASVRGRAEPRDAVADGDPYVTAPTTAAGPSSSRPAPSDLTGDRDMVAIPEGTFEAGTVDPADPRRHPARVARVAAFRMDRNLVSVASYDRCEEAGACSRSQSWASPLCNERIEVRRNRARHPINCVTWAQANAYCGWVGKRLPGQDEWEYAARGTDGRRYPWGNGPIPAGVCFNRSTTCQSATGDASPFGVNDMAGNVWEWTATPTPGREKPPHREYIIFGGSFDNDDPEEIRSDRPDSMAAEDDSFGVGFRCAR